MKTYTMLLVLLASACSPKVPISNANIDLQLEQSHTLVKAGESVTFTANATGISGRDEKIKWNVKGGDYKTPNDMERYQQVRYEKPGTYTVTASLIVDDKLVDQETATVTVEPLG